MTAPSSSSYSSNSPAEQAAAYSWPATNELPIVESFLGETAVRSLDAAEFDLLLRSVDAVVKSQSFSRPLFQFAMRTTDDETTLTVGVLEALGLISAGGRDEARTVNAQIEHLQLIVTRLHEAQGTR